MSNLQKILANNRAWSKQTLAQDPQFFNKHLKSESPKILWIGCSDSRIPEQTILGLQPGDLFVHRNIANQVPLSDFNTLSVVQYAVEVLQVTDIIVCGHYGCGGVRAAFKKFDYGPLETWLSYIRDNKIRHSHLLNKTHEQNQRTLVQLNVKVQIYDIGKIDFVQKAWLDGKKLRVRGVIYQLDNGVLKDFGICLDKMSMISKEFWHFDSQKFLPDNIQLKSEKVQHQQKKDQHKTDSVSQQKTQPKDEDIINEDQKAILQFLVDMGLMFIG